MLIADFLYIIGAPDLSAWRAVLVENGTWLRDWVLNSYAESPALVLGVGFALALPLVATLGVIVRQLLGVAGRATGRPELPTPTLPPSAWRQSAWLEHADRSEHSFPLRQSLVRIGRERDNDVCLGDPNVARYHAVLERTPEAEYIISYIGDPAGRGLVINGRPVQRQRLRGGEVLEFGARRMRFSIATGTQSATGREAGRA